MATVDLKDAYFLLKIHPDSRKYLRFLFEGRIYEFNVLPFGLNTAPYIFTKIMKPVVQLLRLAGYISTIYLDDLLLMGRSFNECTKNITMTIKLLTALGFIVNYDKSNLTPSFSCRFLGFIIDSHKLQICLPKEKRTRIRTELLRIMNLHQCKIKTFARIIGLLVSACPAIEYGWLYTKQFERFKYLKLQGHKDYNKIIHISESLYSDFSWWLRNLGSSVRKIRSEDYLIEIYSDASTTGWGAACGSESTSGQWSEQERNQHINYLELLAAFFALKIFAANLQHCEILLRIDNTTAISYINRMGGIQYPHLTRLTKDIWQWCELRNVYIFAYYVRSSDNTIADAESRRTHPDIEWELSDSAFNQITNAFGQPNIDLFATRVNKKCNRFVSWHRDPDAFQINAFTMKWSEFYFYAFPPFSIILRCLQKIITDRARGIVVVPRWPTQPWYPLFQSLLISNLLILKPHENIKISLVSRWNVQKNLTLVAGILYGGRYYDETSH